MVRLVWHNHKENELRVLDLTATVHNDGQDLFIVVVLNRLSEALKQHFLVVCSLVRDGAHISEFHLDFKTFLSRQVVELIIDVVGVVDVSLEAEDGKAFKHLGLVNHSVQVVRIVKNASRRPVSVFMLLTRVLVATRLSLEVRRLINFRTLEYFSLNAVGLKRNFKTPLLDFLGVGDHIVQLTN